jgi:hypothetical protein
LKLKPKPIHTDTTKAIGLFSSLTKENKGRGKKDRQMISTNASQTTKSQTYKEDEESLSKVTPS